MALCSAAQCRPLPQRASLRVPSSSSGFLGAGSIPRAPLRAVSRPAARQVKVSGLFGLGVPELAVIAGVAALIFGPSKLPEIGKGLGQTVKSFQTAAKEFEKELKDAAASDEEQPKQPPAAEKKDDAPKQ